MVRPAYKEEPNQPSEVIQEEMSEVSLSQVDDQVDECSDSEEEAPVFLDLTGLRPGRELEGDAGVGLDSALEGTVSTQDWRLEVERVLPSLKIQVRQDNRVSLHNQPNKRQISRFLYLVQDWRGHYEQMHAHSDGIKSALSETKGYLDKLHQEITKTLEKIGSREKYINNQVSDYR